jgi:hypothetical protein
MDHLAQKGQIQFSSALNGNLFCLTEKGKNNFNKIINNFSLNNIFPFKSEVIFSEIPLYTKMPPFLGYFVANKDGLLIFRVELHEGLLLKFLKTKVEKDSHGKNDKFDVELIPMFISALEKFSLEINIQNLSGFSLMGSNLKLQIFGFDQYTVTFFSNPNTNMKNIEYKIKNYFNNIFEAHEEEFKKAMPTGDFSNLSYLEKEGVKWLEQLNKMYEYSVHNLDFYDIEGAKNLYNGLDDLQNEFNLEYEITLEKIKKLKVELMKAILIEDFEEIKNLSTIVLNLKSKLISRIN